MKIEKKLNEWVSKSLITKEQQASIVNYEKEIASKSNKVLYAFLTFGVLLIGIGIISIIASNWENIPEIVKLCSGLLFMIILGFVHVKFQKNELIKEGSLFLFYLYLLAYIGLVSQIFHLSSYLNRGFLFWAVISSPLILITTKPYLPFVWLGSLICSVLPEFLRIDFIKDIFDKRITALSFCITLIAFILAFWIILSKYLIKNEIIKKVVNFYFLGGVILNVIMIDIISYDRYRGKIQSIDPNFILFLMTILIPCLILLFRELAKKYYFFLISLIVMFIISISEISFMIPRIYMVWFIFTFGYIMIYSAINERNVLFNLAFFIACLRIIIFYASFIESLLYNGIFMVISGILFILFILLFNKYKKPLMNFIKLSFKDRGE
ncbi:MAG: hypothetical protein BWY78_01135 [Alphaproteobacteria bacterium ADurb.Bin438]|nr:MAG: hypothetical protein BWY78_01135 [Alphaproteobacteria bacterium ADurb.Bin438]